MLTFVQLAPSHGYHISIPIPGQVIYGIHFYPRTQNRSPSCRPRLCLGLEYLLLRIPRLHLSRRSNHEPLSSGEVSRSFSVRYDLYDSPAELTRVRILWSAALLCTAATQNAAGLQATRFFLGFMEAAVAPGFGLITSMWYKRSEQPLRMGAWFMGNVCSGLFGALLAYGVGHIETIAPWRVCTPFMTSF